MDEEGRAFLDGGVSPAETLPAPIGRPSDYTHELAKRICDAIAGGMRMKDVANLEGFPGKSTIFDWLNIHQDFARMYENAMLWRAEEDADWLMDIALDRSQDYKLEDPVGGEGLPVKVLDKTAIERSKLACAQLRYLMGRRSPKKYAENAGEQLLIAPQQPGRPSPGDDAKLIGESSTIEGNPFEASLRAFDAITGPSKVIAG